MFLKYNSDRINSEDREHGAMQCQSLCERVYDDYTYWIYRLQEQTCEVWSLNIFFCCLLALKNLWWTDYTLPL